MSTATAEAPKKRKKETAKVPDYLIYEVVRGKPIYYKGYKDGIERRSKF
ncbi:MAG: hypothetical protein IPM82_24000 [Saprospiraceae bacterium]|nr:hypothetical protein [Saprospiraceae bacterium]